MSIGIATICVDGLVIAADSEISSPAGFKFNETKLFKIRMHPSKGSLVLVYAGVPSTNRLIVEGLREKLENQDKTREEIRRDFQDVLDGTIAETSDQQTLCGFRDEGSFHIFKSFGREISPVPVWDYAGIGDSALTRYLGAIFLEKSVHLPVFRAVPICNYIVAQAKKYVQGCGGPTDLAVLTVNGEVFEQSFSAAIDAACEMIEKMFNGILTALSEPNADLKGYEMLLTTLRNMLESSSKSFQAFLTKTP